VAVDYTIDMMFAFDMCFNFRTAYVDAQGNMVRTHLLLLTDSLSPYSCHLSATVLDTSVATLST
jgi:hypothetical protein